MLSPTDFPILIVLTKCPSKKRCKLFYSNGLQLHLFYLQKEPLVAVELQLCGDLPFLFLHCQPNRIQYQVHSLSCGGFVIYNTVIIDIADHGQIQNTLTGMDVGNICDPPGVWSICLEIPVEQVLIFVELLSHLNPLFWSAYFGKQTIFFHDSQYCFGVPVDPLTLQPYPQPAISVGLPAIFLLILDKLTQFSIYFWLAQATDKVIIAAPGYPKESAHYRNWILCSVLCY